MRIPPALLGIGSGSSVRSLSFEGAVSLTVLAGNSSGSSVGASAAAAGESAQAVCPSNTPNAAMSTYFICKIPAQPGFL
jgi:hypothetical protein